MAFLQTPGSWRSKQTGLQSQDPASSPAGPARRSPFRKSYTKPRRDVLSKTDAPVVAEISRADLNQFLSSVETKIMDLEHLASYNWLDGRNPIIAVPGAPPLYNPPTTPPNLDPDSGEIFVDQNAARNPNSPLEPLFRSLYSLHPTFNISDIDLVTDRNNIRKFLRFITGASKDAFEIKVEIVGEKTTLLTRVSPYAKTTTRGFQGFGHNFEKAITKDHVGTGHHRIVSYQFGGMKMIVRHETDGYLDEKYDSFGDVAFMLPAGFGTESGPAISALETLQISTTKEAAVIEEKPAVEGSGLAAVKESATTDKISTTEILPATDTPNLPRKTRATQTTDTLSNLLDSLSIADSKSFNTNPTISTTPTKPTTPYKPTTSQTLEIKPLGTPFPPSLMLEIKTRAASKSLNLRETLPQLWISQTPHLVVGYHHSGGWFDRIKVKNMRSSINEWEEMNQETLRKLVGLIKWIVEKVQGVEGKRGTVRFEGGDVIKVMGIAEETNVAISPMMSKTAKKKEKKQKKMMLRRALPDDLYEKWSFTNEHVGEKGFGDGEVNGGGVRLV